MRLTRLTQYKQWANEQLFECITQVPAARLSAAHPIVFGSLINTLHHVLRVDLIFRAHLTGVDHGFTTRRPEDSPSADALSREQRDVDAWYIDYARTLSDAERLEIVEFEFIGGGDGAMSREDILLHIVNHGTYHRGHVGTMLYDISVKPPTTDYPVFLRDASHS